MIKDILPEDESGHCHGYCEVYMDGVLYWRGVRFHGYNQGYHESYDTDGTIKDKTTGYYLGEDMYYGRISIDNKEGYCYMWNRTEL